MPKSVSVKKVYDQGYAQMDQLLSHPRINAINQLLQTYIPRDIERLLDLGCGDGKYTQMIGYMVNARELYGIDISQKAVIESENYGLNATQLDVDESDLPYKANFFDFIFVGNLIELILDADHLISEMQRVLKPNGTIIVSFPNISAWMSRIASVLGFLPYYARVSTKYDMGKLMSKTTRGDSTGFIRLMNLSVFRQLARIYGFEIIKAVGITEPALPKPLHLLDNLLSKNPKLAFQLVCVLKKK